MNYQLVKSLNPFKSVILTNYDLMKAHGGELKVKSEVGIGSEFIIQFPLT